MDAVEERLVNERMRQKLNAVNEEAQSHLTGVYDHINFTLQQAYFKCAYDCFDRQKNQDEINRCVEHCTAPLTHAQNLVQNQMADFQEKLNRSLRVCQDRYESANMQVKSNEALKQMESCVDMSVEDSIRLLPHIAGKLRNSLSIND